MLDEGPSKLYDALSKVLGLDDLVDAQTALQQARSAREKTGKEADQARKLLLETLAKLSDERAQKAKGALARKDWGLDEVEALLAGSPTSPQNDSAIEILRRLAVLEPPDQAAVVAAVQALRDAAARQEAAAQTVAGKSEQLAALGLGYLSDELFLTTHWARHSAQAATRYREQMAAPRGLLSWSDRISRPPFRNARQATCAD